MKEVFNGECVISLVIANRNAKNNHYLQASFPEYASHLLLVDQTGSPAPTTCHWLSPC